MKIHRYIIKGMLEAGYSAQVWSEDQEPDLNWSRSPESVVAACEDVDISTVYFQKGDRPFWNEKMTVVCEFDTQDDEYVADFTVRGAVEVLWDRYNAIYCGKRVFD